MRSKEEIAGLFDSFSKMNILIIGDVMIDAYLWGNVDRISPEAPVPIVTVKKRANRLGGAANVALNVRAMGGRALLCSVIGKDEKAEQFEQLMQENDLATHGLLKSEERITTTKFRVLGNNMQMLRVDEEIDNPLSHSDLQDFSKILESMIAHENIDAIIFQDYDKGVITPEVINHITNIALERDIPVAVDPKKRNFSNYKNVTLFKPNLKELKEGLGIDFQLDDLDNLCKAVRQIHDAQHINIVLATLSDKGIYVSKKLPDGSYEAHHIPAHVRQISDVSGAGDTVISVASMCIAANIPMYHMASTSNLAGGQVCESIGVVPVNRNKLMVELQGMIK
nr:D-glycero-beta-D-manno-heptose-7-phosphate kinase [Bacteroidota bacterium]